MEETKYSRSSLDSMIPNNSDKAKREQETRTRKKQEPIVKGIVTKQKKGTWQRIKESLVGDDTRGVGDYVLHDVLIPAFKATISDMIGGGMDMLLFGERRGRSNISRDRGRSYVSYGGYYKDDYRSRDRYKRDDRRQISRQTRATHNFDDVVFDSREEAELVLVRLVDLTIEYDRASVMDFYELSNIETSFTDDNYGWTNLRDAHTDRVRSGYIICFPPARPLN